jgi:alanyl-tRNA synthetase
MSNATARLRNECDYWRERAYELMDELECWENGTFRRGNAKYWDSWTDTHNEIKAMKAELAAAEAAKAAAAEEKAAAKQAAADAKAAEAAEKERAKEEAREYQREQERMASVAAAITLNRSAAAAKSSNKKVSFHSDVEDWPTMF